MTDSKQARIVFIGCGLIGRNVLAETVAKLPNADFTLIDTKNYFENNTGSVRSVVVDDFLPKTTITHASWLPTNVRLIVGYATQVTKTNTVVVNTNGVNTIVPFDFLVVQTGSTYAMFKSSAGGLDARTAEVQASIRRVKEAKSILVIGGGQVGVEVAAEIAAEYPGKKVTIIHSHARFVQVAPPKLHNKFAQWFKTNKVTTILNDRVLVDKPAEGKAWDDEKKGAADGVAPLEMKTYRTEKGVAIEADLVFTCTGHRFNSDMMTENFATSLASNRQIKVNRNFIVEGTTNILAVGDICNADPCPLAAAGKDHVPIAVHNLQQLVNARATGRAASLKNYTRSKFEWGPGTCLGPAVMIVCIPVCCGTVLLNLKGKMKTDLMMTKPEPRK